MIVHPNFDPVALSVGPLSIHWYGLTYLAGFAAAMALGFYRAKKADSGWTTDQVLDLVFYIAVGVIVGGRLGYVVFYNLAYYASNPFDIFSIWDGGMSFHGGLIGIFVSAWLFAIKTNRAFLHVADFATPLGPIGLFFGRVGNFINQELWGRATEMPWGVLFHTAPEYPRHPSQLYEAFLEGLVLFLVLWIYSSKARGLGKITGLFLVGYAVFRFLVEFFREPDAHLNTIAFDWMTMGQLLCLPMALVGVHLLIRRSSKTV